MKLTIMPALAVALLALALAPEAALADGKSKRDCFDADLITFEGAQPVTGKSRLCVNRRGINASLRAKDLVPGDAYTVWWIYFDDPSQCDFDGDGVPNPGVCGPPDFGGEKPRAVLGRMDSGIAPKNGRRWFTDRLNGFRPSSGSQVWLVLQVHGPARLDDGDALARQLLTHEDLPLGGAPHLTNTVDGQLGFPNALAVFVIP